MTRTTAAPSPPQADSSERLPGARPSLVRLATGFVFAVLALGAALAFLASVVPAVFVLSLTPNPGADAVVLVLKIVLASGWVLIGIWGTVDLVRGRWRGFLSVAAVWAWLWTLGSMLASSAYLDWGY
jgi:hypothetical protein